MYRRNRELLIDCLGRLGITDIAPSDGAFYIYASIAHLTDDSLALCKRLLEDTGVATAPGLDFDPERGARFIRFSYAVSTDMAQEACARLEAWFAGASLAGSGRV